MWWQAKDKTRECKSEETREAPSVTWVPSSLFSSRSCFYIDTYLWYFVIFTLVLIKITINIIIKDQSCSGNTHLKYGVLNHVIFLSWRHLAINQKCTQARILEDMWSESEVTTTRSTCTWLATIKMYMIVKFLPFFSTSSCVPSPVDAKNSSPPPVAPVAPQALQWHLTFQTCPPTM